MISATAGKKQRVVRNSSTTGILILSVKGASECRSHANLIELNRRWLKASQRNQLPRVGSQCLYTDIFLLLLLFILLQSDGPEPDC